MAVVTCAFCLQHVTLCKGVGTGAVIGAQQGRSVLCSPRPVSPRLGSAEPEDVKNECTQCSSPLCNKVVFTGCVDCGFEVTCEQLSMYSVSFGTGNV